MDNKFFLVSSCFEKSIVRQNVLTNRDELLEVIDAFVEAGYKQIEICVLTKEDFESAKVQFGYGDLTYDKPEEH